MAAQSPTQNWFDQLNRDPGARSTAGLGSRVLRRNVEDVMARAWQQVGEVDEANAALRRLQVSRSVTASIHQRHLSALSAGALVSVARPLLMGVNAVQYGIVLILAMGVGAFIPPIGVGFYVSAAVAGAELEPAAKTMIPYAIVLVLAVLLIAFVPAITLVLPRLLEGRG